MKISELNTKKFRYYPDYYTINPNGNSYIYILIDDDEIVYVGQTTNLENRVKVHKNSEKVFDQIMFRQFDKRNLDLLESFLIFKILPKYNKALRNTTRYCNYVLLDKRTLKLVKNSGINTHPVGDKFYVEIPYHKDNYKLISKKKKRGSQNIKIDSNKLEDSYLGDDTEIYHKKIYLYSNMILSKLSVNKFGGVTSILLAEIFELIGFKVKLSFNNIYNHSDLPKHEIKDGITNLINLGVLIKNNDDFVVNGSRVSEILTSK